MVNVKEVLTKYGYDKARDLILKQCLTLVEFHLETGLSTSKSRTSQRIYKEAFEFLNVVEIPYAQDTKPMRLFKTAFDSVNGRYWESEYLCEVLLDRLLNNTTKNKSENSVRLVISFPKHPRADPTSNQIKAHIVMWEIFNEQYVPENHWVVPVDGNYTNLNIENLVLLNKTQLKSDRNVGSNNPQFKHGMASRPKLGGWSLVSKNILNAENCKCAKCGSNKDLVVHHIINYHLFTEPIRAHDLNNLIVFCNSCHAKIHQNNLSIKALIEETQYSKLLELLETLKSQVPESLVEILQDVEKQLGLTDNQQPST